MQKIELLPGSRKTLDSLLRELSYIREEISRVQREINELGNTQRDNDTIEHLQSIPGVGPIVSAAFYYEIFRPERFPRSEELGRYLGLAPVPRQSGESKGRARRVPSGQRILRSILVQAAWRWRDADAWASQYYNRILSHCGLSQKAIVALARKLAVIMWRIILENRPYRPGCIVS